MKRILKKTVCFQNEVLYPALILGRGLPTKDPRPDSTEETFHIKSRQLTTALLRHVTPKWIGQEQQKSIA